MPMSAIEQVRSFNRTVTARIGALDDHFLGRAHPLGEARLLWEIGAAGATVPDLVRRLGLDPAYLRRLLLSLEAQGLMVVRTEGPDGGATFVQLTEAGQRERAELDTRAEGFAESVLSPLSEQQRDKLVAAMAEVERLLLASLVAIAPTDPASAEARWCIAQYFAELDTRFTAGFDPAQSISADATELAPPNGVLLVARLREEPVGCGALKLHGPDPAELKRMWVAPQARGLGLGRRMLEALEDYARAAGVTVLHLETNRSLVEAIALYRRAGYQEVPAFNAEPYAHHWFEKRL